MKKNTEDNSMFLSKLYEYKSSICLVDHGSGWNLIDKRLSQVDSSETIGYPKKTIMKVVDF